MLIQKVTQIYLKHSRYLHWRIYKESLIPEIPLPDNVLPSYFCDDDEFFDGEELYLLNASDQMENLNPPAQNEAQVQDDGVDELMDNDDNLLNAVENMERTNKS